MSKTIIAFLAGFVGVIALVLLTACVQPKPVDGPQALVAFIYSDGKIVDALVGPGGANREACLAIAKKAEAQSTATEKVVVVCISEPAAP